MEFVIKNNYFISENDKISSSTIHLMVGKNINTKVRENKTVVISRYFGRAHIFDKEFIIDQEYKNIVTKTKFKCISEKPPLLSSLTDMKIKSNPNPLTHSIL